MNDDNFCQKCGSFYSAGGYCTNGHFMSDPVRPPVPNEQELLKNKMISLLPSYSDIGSIAATSAANTLANDWADQMCRGHKMEELIIDSEVTKDILNEWFERLREEFCAPKIKTTI